MSIPIAITVLTVSRVEERTYRVHLSGYGDTATFEERTRGWWTVFLENHMAVYVGPTKPALEVGDQLRLTLERA